MKAEHHEATGTKGPATMNNNHANWPYGPPPPAPPGPYHPRPQTYPRVVINGSPQRQPNGYPGSLTQAPNRNAYTQRPPYHPQLAPFPHQYTSKPVYRAPQPQAPIPNIDGADDVPVKPVITRDLPVDYRLLLISLADQYLGEAQSLGTLIAHNQAGADETRYYKLMATCMSCYEAVLKKVGIQFQTSVQEKLG